MADFSLHRHLDYLFDAASSQTLSSYYLHVYLLLGLCNLLERRYSECQQFDPLFPIRDQRSGRLVLFVAALFSEQARTNRG